MKVLLTVTESRCRCGCMQEGATFLVDTLCPPVCHELWAGIYPMVYALQNGAVLDFGEDRGPMFCGKCPDEGRVTVYGRVVTDEEPAE